MEYSIHRLSRLAGVSTRTLRYYDEIGLLKPARIASSGYRVYGAQEVDLLQQILFYRELGFELSEIKNLLYAADFDPERALSGHLEALILKRVALDRLIDSVRLTLKHQKGEITMSDNEKFEAFKKQLVDENERLYGEEIRGKYGEEEVEASNAKMMNLSREDYRKMEELSQKILSTLAEAVKTGDPGSPLAQEVCELHKTWLGFSWKEYSGAAHLGLGEMYVSDERFRAYYDKAVPGGAEFLRDALKIYCSEG